jgi:putative redox protein
MLNMTQAIVRWSESDRFVGESGGHEIAMDAGSQKSAQTPMELLLVALCGCTASDVVNILRKKREPFTSLEVSAEGERAESVPRVYTHIRLTYRVGGNVAPKAMEDAVRLSKEKYCSVSQMLQKAAQIDFVIEYAERPS